VSKPNFTWQNYAKNKKDIAAWLELGTIETTSRSRFRKLAAASWQRDISR